MVTVGQRSATYIRTPDARVTRFTRIRARKAPAPIPPTTLDEQPPPDPGLIALTVAEINRLFMLVTRRFHH
jgi:hypothetical protein